ncbi:MAG TPA: ORF6N domain-containing protein [Phycisphaerales bacterium]|jgi:hypothetical protein|nr:ORF6N domain-containing protein [Phycisphaerales bacterium]
MAKRKAARRRSEQRKGMRSLLAPEQIGRKILSLRGHKVLVDTDLAELYGVSTKSLNQAVKRNVERFPGDFMFRLTGQERDEVVANCDHLARLKFSAQLPRVFTEQGVAMLSSVLRSPKAVAVNIEIMRAFVRIRQIIGSSEELARRIEALDAKFEGKTREHSEHIQQLYALLDQLMSPPDPPKKRRIGFYDPDVDGEITTHAPKGARRKSELARRA